MSWKTNAIMEWQDINTNAWRRITDHNRSPLDISVERIERSQRMAGGTMRRYVVNKKRNFSCSWELLPPFSRPEIEAIMTARILGFDDLATDITFGKGGPFTTADENFSWFFIEEFHDNPDGDQAFQMALRSGEFAKLDAGERSGDFEVYTVMLTEFSKNVQKRGSARFPVTWTQGKDTTAGDGFAIGSTRGLKNDPVAAKLQTVAVDLVNLSVSLVEV